MLITKRIGGGLGYFQCSKFAAFSSEDATGSNLFVGGTASAESEYAGFPAANAFDNTDNSWSSLTNNKETTWIRYDLPIAVSIKSITVASKGAANDGPRDFIIQGSNDNGATWENLADFSYFAVASNIVVGVSGALFQCYLSGKALADDGVPAISVFIYDWESGDLLYKRTPRADGSWLVTMKNPAQQALVVIKGPAATRPEAHGPVNPYQFLP